MEKPQESIALSSEDDQLLAEFLLNDSDRFAAPSAEFSLHDDSGRMYAILITVFTTTMVVLTAAWLYYGKDVRTAFSERDKHPTRSTNQLKKTE